MTPEARKILEQYLAAWEKARLGQSSAPFPDSMEQERAVRHAFERGKVRLSGSSDPRAAISEPEPVEKCPSMRLVAVPCVEGTRFLRYEAVSGTSEMILVSVEVVKS